MFISKNDIGAEVISILTKGMYPDPKDALREYIQNGVDADAKNIGIKIRQKTIIIEDDGQGMNHDVLRKAIRVGISEKNPAKNVGFMGIGIYSAFHLCDKLIIYSRGTENISNKLQMDFGSMRIILDDQKEKRLSRKIRTEDLIDLQTLLESYITLTKNGSMATEQFPMRGTRIELTGLETEFYSALSDFEDVAEYLRNVIPLPFDHVKFTYGERIEKRIADICAKHNQKFEIIKLKLQINSEEEELFRPYRDTEFNSKTNTKPLPPKFFIIKNSEFFGVAWGCLNSVRKKIENKSLRGFILKRQGFSIGKRENMVRFFPRGNTFFDRYSGEVILINPKLMPNASRTELEYSPLRNIFYQQLLKFGEKFDQIGNEFQEFSKGDDALLKLNEDVRGLIGTYNESEGDPQIIIQKIVDVNDIINVLEGRIDRRGFSEETNIIAKELLKQAKDLRKVFQERINTLTKRKKNQKETERKSTLQIAKKLSKIKIAELVENSDYSSLYDLLYELEFNIDNDLKEVINIIDEKFIQKEAKTKEIYTELLNELKNEILNI
jgi:hypothetical protein